MIPWMLAGALIGLCAMLLWTLLHERKESDRLRAENKTLLATALEARGVMYVNPDKERAAIPFVPGPKKGLASRLIALEERDRKRAEELEAQLKAQAQAAERRADELSG